MNTIRWLAGAALDCVHKSSCLNLWILHINWTTSVMGYCQINRIIIYLILLCSILLITAIVDNLLTINSVYLTFYPYIDNLLSIWPSYIFMRPSIFLSKCHPSPRIPNGTYQITSHLTMMGIILYLIRKWFRLSITATVDNPLTPKTYLDNYWVLKFI